jgi:CRISPR/Cas system Type II protein with McrA/HNH and RuvC-like nuclease domain
VIFEWAKFLEPRNIGYPQIIKSIESEFEPRGLQKERKLLEKIQDRCFYCNSHLLGKSEINVEHVIPYSYLKHNKMWNLTLACKKCNCKKLGSLPKSKSTWMNEIHKRNGNEKFRTKIPLLDKHLQELGSDYKIKMEIMYDLAINQGFSEKKMP